MGIALGLGRGLSLASYRAAALNQLQSIQFRPDLSLLII